jgi:hypothetical protein
VQRLVEVPEGARAAGMSSKDSLGTIETFKMYEDGSGAPATVNVKGWVFALDLLGEVKCSLLTVNASGIPPKWAAEWARAVYMSKLMTEASPEWFELNRKMYK